MTSKGGKGRAKAVLVSGALATTVAGYRSGRLSYETRQWLRQRVQPWDRAAVSK